MLYILYPTDLTEFSVDVLYDHLSLWRLHWCLRRRYAVYHQSINFNIHPWPIYFIEQLFDLLFPLLLDLVLDVYCTSSAMSMSPSTTVILLEVSSFVCYWFCFIGWLVLLNELYSLIHVIVSLWIETCTIKSYPALIMFQILCFSVVYPCYKLCPCLFCVF